MQAVARWARVAAINAAVAVGILIVAELALGDWTGPEPLDGNEANCSDELVHHFYCPSVRLRRFLSGADGGGVVHSFINRSGVAVADASLIGLRTDVARYDVINIGDSFLESQAVPFSQRLSQRMRELGVNALQVGYSSWAPITMLNWLKANPPNRGAHVNLFVMTNDFTPSYGWANINYYKHLVDPASAEPRFQVLPSPSRDMSLGRRIERRSFVWPRLKRLRTTLALPRASIAAGPALTSTAFASPDESCAPLPDFEARRAQLPSLLLDYIYFARPRRCWPAAALASVDSAVGDIRRISEYLTSRGVTLTVLLIPAGWAFPGETLVGKAAPDYYGIAERVTVTQAGLAMELAAQLKGIELIDLEPVIGELKRNDPALWYFPSDGHWTAHAQTELAKWLVARRR
jgi:hypothetical protein